MVIQSSNWPGGAGHRNGLGLDLFEVWAYYEREFGVWRSPVARMLWEHDVGGSNPLTPIFLSTL